MPLLAGMPVFDLGDVAALRVQAISFFLVVLLASAFAIQKIWNGLRKDFGSLPELSYKKALGLMVLWGLLFLLVLTMISGARELLTPGAWKKDGATYKLAEPEKPVPQTFERSSDEPARRQRLEAVRAALWSWAEKNAHALPDEIAAAGSESLARVAEHPQAARYVYVKGHKVGEGDAPIAFEPAAFGRSRLVLLASGKIEVWPSAKLPSR
ncbi:MAG: hypothetical protein ACAI25_15245 [Planctomycetota bacterium]